MAADSTIKQLFAELASLNLQLEAAKSEARDRDVLLHKLQAETDSFRTSLEDEARLRIDVSQTLSRTQEIVSLQQSQIEQLAQRLEQGKRIGETKISTAENELNIARLVETSLRKELVAVAERAEERVHTYLEQSIMQGYFMRACDEFVVDWCAVCNKGFI